jgi:hypothetical protein
MLRLSIKRVFGCQFLTFPLFIRADAITMANTVNSRLTQTLGADDDPKTPMLITSLADNANDAHLGARITVEGEAPQRRSLDAPGCSSHRAHNVMDRSLQVGEPFDELSPLNERIKLILDASAAIIAHRTVLEAFQAHRHNKRNLNPLLPNETRTWEGIYRCLERALQVRKVIEL